MPDNNLNRERRIRQEQVDRRDDLVNLVKQEHWLSKIEALKPGDACEFRYPARSEWLPGIVVQNGGAGWWSVRNEGAAEERHGQIESSLYIEHVRLPGQ